MVERNQLSAISFPKNQLKGSHVTGEELGDPRTRKTEALHASTSSTIGSNDS